VSDGQTNRRTHDNSIYRASIASRGKIKNTMPYNISLIILYLCIEFLIRNRLTNLHKERRFFYRLEKWMTKIHIIVAL